MRKLMEEKENIITLNKAISDLDISHNYFLNVFSSKNLEAGIAET